MRIPCDSLIEYVALTFQEKTPAQVLRALAGATVVLQVDGSTRAEIAMFEGENSPLFSPRFVYRFGVRVFADSEITIQFNLEHVPDETRDQFARGGVNIGVELSCTGTIEIEGPGEGMVN